MFLKILRKKALDDHELLEKFRQSDDLFWLGELYEKYLHLVFGVCLKYLKNEEDSKDAVMQIFERIIPYVKQQKIDNFQHWLYVVVKNHCLMVLRSGKSVKHSLDEKKLEEENKYFLVEEDEFSQEEMERNLQTAIALLPEEQRTCVEMFYIQGKCYKEIQIITGYPYNKVKSSIQNGKRNLRTLMTKFQ
ncbi:MAG: sigma-70 family RNA polymerase sigma factor [Flammeovirgaceae bacterium]|nr:sigma-70 family RNA polymerase sigma factor [Flammeovirgaceae bacterium]MDW8288945.1 sigma-70 family RNA polymerase sigma factor [Flammeovirgaceae bacterium]